MTKPQHATRGGKRQSIEAATRWDIDPPSEDRPLRRVVDGLPIRLWIVAIVGFWERFTFWGVTLPWQNYMEHPSGWQDTPGALGLGQAMATRIYCAFYIFYYVTPLFFGFISDTYLGRFKTLCLCVTLYIFGCAVLTTTSFPSTIRQGLGLPGLVISMIFIGLGGGGFRAVVVPFMADQYKPKESRLRTLKGGEVVVADDLLTLRYICYLYFWAANVGSLSIVATTMLEKRYSFGFAYTTGLTSISVALLILFLGSSEYIKVIHHEKALPDASRILACAAREGFRMSRAEPGYQSTQYGNLVPWSTDAVKELCIGLKACRVLIPFVVFYICFDQMQNNLVSQAAQMDTGWIPNDMVSIINPIACIILGPLIQHLLYPCLERRDISLPPILRITIGFIFMTFAMLYATIVQHIIYTSDTCYQVPAACVGPSAMQSTAPKRVTVWIQAPVYVLIAVGELFSVVTALEYAYSLSPKSMEAVVQAISLLIAGIGSACAMGFSPLARDPYTRTLYFCLSCLMAATTLAFWWCFAAYDTLYGSEHRFAQQRVADEVELLDTPTEPPEKYL